MGNATADIIILGCGGSGGVPFAGGHWGNCDPKEPKNYRTRASIAIRTERTIVVIDTGPDFRQQTVREDLGAIDGIIYSHAHADHINGIDDVRYAAIYRRMRQEAEFTMPLYGDKATLDTIKQAYAYMFETSIDGLYFPLITDNEINIGDDITIGDITVKTFKQTHGLGMSLGFRIGDVGYSTDVSDLPDEAIKSLTGIKSWIVDCGQYGQSEEQLTVHPNLERVLKWNESVQADKIYLTHLTPRNDYNAVNADTPDDIECCYDGLKIKAII